LDLAAAAARGCLKAAAVGLIPMLVIVSMGGYRSVLPLVLGIPTLFIAAAAVLEVHRELHPLEPPPSPPPPLLGPRGVSTQPEAERLIDDLTTKIWESESWSWDS
jgi:hypothetical protein